MLDQPAVSRQSSRCGLIYAFLYLCRLFVCSNVSNQNNNSDTLAFNLTEDFLDL